MGNSGSSDEKKKTDDGHSPGSSRTQVPANSLEQSNQGGVVMAEGASGGKNKELEGARSPVFKLFLTGSGNDLSKVINREEDMSGSDTDEEDEDEEKEVGARDVLQTNKYLKIYHGSDIRNVKEIGRGEFGRMLHGAVHGKGSKPVIVAIKVFYTSMDEDKGAVQLAKLMKLRHRNLVPILGVVLDNENPTLNGPTNCPRILLQFFPEKDLLTYLDNKQNPQDYRQLGKFALDIINGCEYLHSRNIIHGNLAARNIIVQRSVSKYNTHYNAKVTDYGFTQLALDTGNSLKSLRRWWPKEMLEKKKDDTPVKLTFKTDVWAFGVVLWEMWTKGALPYGAEPTIKQVKRDILNGCSPLSIYRPRTCPDHIVDVMNGIFQTNPDERPTFKTLKRNFLDFKAYGIEHKKAGSGNQVEGTGASSSGSAKVENKSKIETGAILSNDPKVAGGKGSSAKESKQGEEAKKDGGNKGAQGASSSTATGKQEGSSNLKQRGKFHPYQKNKPNPPKRIGGNIHAPPPPKRSGHHGNSSAPPPPPYTPTPLPQHHQVNVGPTSTTMDKKSEIQRREKELALLKAEVLQEEFLKKQSELRDIVAKMGRIGLTSDGGAVAAGAGGTLSLAPFPSMMPPPPPPLLGQGGARARGNAPRRALELPAPPRQGEASARDAHHPNTQKPTGRGRSRSRNRKKNADASK